MKIPITRFDSADELSAMAFEAPFNPPANEEGFEDEYCKVHADFVRSARSFFVGLDLDDEDPGVSMSPLFFAATRKLGIVVDTSAYQNPMLSKWLAKFVSELEPDYMVTVDSYCDSGQMYACFTRSLISVFGPESAVEQLGLNSQVLEVQVWQESGV